jgi:hypothetical protein
MPTLSTEQVTTHTLTLTEAELAEWREAALCALDLGGDKDDHMGTWRTIARLGLPPTRGDDGPRLGRITQGQLARITAGD